MYAAVKVLGGVVLAFASGIAQQPSRRAPRPQAGPTPRLADGKPDFGGDGMWNPRYAGNMAETFYHGVPGVDEKIVPFQPWAKKVFDDRQASDARDDPEARCLPAGLPRYMYTPYPFEMIQTGSRVIFLYKGSAHIWRSVPIDDNLSHPADPNPTWMGDSAGHWEGEADVRHMVGR